jgi:peptidyl-tRNA hydrolase
MKLFVIVRKDLSTSQRAVQAGHAVAAYLLHGSFLRRWQNETLIYLGVKGLKQLENLKRKFEMNGINYIEFREPDLNNETTAITTDIENVFVERLNLL